MGAGIRRAAIFVGGSNKETRADVILHDTYARVRCGRDAQVSSASEPLDERRIQEERQRGPLLLCLGSLCLLLSKRTSECPAGLPDPHEGTVGLTTSSRPPLSHHGCGMLCHWLYRVVLNKRAP